MLRWRCYAAALLLMHPSLSFSKTPAPSHLSPQQAKAAITRVKETWHAATGETADEVFANAEKEAHFVPRDYEAFRIDAAKVGVSRGWNKHRLDGLKDAFPIIWNISGNGTIEVEPPYAKTLELGSAAFIISLIQSEVDDGEVNANSYFLRNPLSYNFVVTPQGKLGDLLIQGKCSLQNPSNVFFSPDFDGRKQDQAFYLQLSVDCAGGGPPYFTENGYISFRRDQGATDWHPLSFFAKRLWDYPPTRWFQSEEPVERTVFNAVSKRLSEIQSKDLDINDVCKFIEVRNSGTLSGPLIDKDRVDGSVLVLIKIYLQSQRLVTAASMVSFMRHAGSVAIRMTDEAVISNSRLMMLEALSSLNKQ